MQSTSFQCLLFWSARGHSAKKSVVCGIPRRKSTKLWTHFIKSRCVVKLRRVVKLSRLVKLRRFVKWRRSVKFVHLTFHKVMTFRQVETGYQICPSSRDVLSNSSVKIWRFVKLRRFVKFVRQDLTFRQVVILEIFLISLLRFSLSSFATLMSPSSSLRFSR